MQITLVPLDRLSDLHVISCMSNSIVSISQSVILRHSDFEFEQAIAFEFSPLSYFQYNLRSISTIFSYFTPALEFSVIQCFCGFLGILVL